MFNYFTLDRFDFKNKIVVVRVDINSPIKNGKIILNERITQACETISELVSLGAKVLILGHQGRLGKKDCLSLKNHKKFLENELKFSIGFVDSVFSSRVLSSIEKMKFGSVLLLENVRFFEGVEGFENVFSDLGGVIDYFVNDAFSVSHRSQPSVVGVGCILGGVSGVSGVSGVPCVAGRLLEKELRNLNKLSETKDPRSYVLGGAKPDDLIDLIEIGFKNKLVDNIFLSGIIGEVALVCLGYDLGLKNKFLLDHGFLSVEKKLSMLLKKYSSKIYTPRDLAIVASGKRIEIDVNDLSLPKNKKLIDKSVLSDIGAKTVKYYEMVLSNSESIYLKGPAGNFEERGFEVGTKKLFKAITDLPAFSFMGGGHSVTAASELGFFDKFDYVSLAGGALVNFICSKPLPGIEILEMSFEKYKGYCEYFVMGSNVIDETIDLGEKLSEVHLGEKIRVSKDFKKTVGGGGVNISVALSKLGARVDYLGKHSYDSYDVVKKDLEQAGVVCVDSKISKVGCAKSVILDTEDNDRVIFTFRGQNSLLEMSDFDINSFKSNYFYLTSLQGKSFDTQLKFVDEIKKRNKKAIFCYGASSSLVGKEPKLNNLIKKCDIIILNFDEAQILVGKDSMSECLKSIYDFGVRLVVITDGSNGSYVFDGKKEYFFTGEKPKHVVDATGAGDCFGATFFYFYTKGYPIKKSMEYATKNAVSVISKKGAHLGLKSLKELL
jgi:phosphoglycerate kinase